MFTKNKTCRFKIPLNCTCSKIAQGMQILRQVNQKIQMYTSGAAYCKINIKSCTRLWTEVLSIHACPMYLICRSSMP